MFWIYVIIAFFISSYLMKIGWDYMRPKSDPIQDVLESLYMFFGMGGMIGVLSIVIYHLVA
jgi:hypothetical protein